MITAFKELKIEQLNKDLGIALGIVEVKDYTVIPVTVKYPGGTTQTVEDGIVTYCDHAGADLGNIELESLYYDPRTGTVSEMDNTHHGLVCDKCPAWQDENGDWNE